MFLNRNENLYDYFFLLRYIGLDYEVFKKMSLDKRKDLIKSIQRDNITKFRSEKIHKIFGE